MRIEGTHPGSYDIGRTEPDLLRTNWSVGEEGFSAVFLEGPGYTEIPDRYTARNGRPPLGRGQLRLRELELGLEPLPPRERDGAAAPRPRLAGDRVGRTVGARLP